jgi:hypothetical protein
MGRAVSRVFIAAVLLVGVTSGAWADVCVNIDESQDTFSLPDRAASLILIAKAFRQEGEQVGATGCTASYVLSHVRLGNVIMVTLAGPNGEREGRALGIDDLPALYSQMVRSIITGRPMTGFNVVDRTNVTAAQTSQRRVQTDGFTYARLGYGATFFDKAQGAPTMGIGYRAELDAFAIDVSFLNYQMRSGRSYSGSPGYYGSASGFSGSFLKLEGLYFLKPAANASAYMGGGLSWGGTSTSKNTANSYTSIGGSGLQGELTLGYELPRASTLRAFVQVDTVLPFYRAAGDTVTFNTTPPYNTSRTSGSSRYTPSLSLSLGLGWQRHRK